MLTSSPVQSGNSGGSLLDTSGNFAVKSAMVANFLDVNRVVYKTGAPGAAMQPADIADEARAVNGFVVCR